MTALTAAQIATGAKNARKIEAPKTSWDQPGRWRCWLCTPPRWRRGTQRAAHAHYIDVHYHHTPEEHR